MFGEKVEALKLHGRVCAYRNIRTKRQCFHHFKVLKKHAYPGRLLCFVRVVFERENFLNHFTPSCSNYGDDSHRLLLPQEKTHSKNPRSNTGTENEIPLQEYDSRFQECCDHVSKEEVSECASKGCYERASYVVLVVRSARTSLSSFTCSYHSLVSLIQRRSLIQLITLTLNDIDIHSLIIVRLNYYEILNSRFALEHRYSMNVNEKSCCIYKAEKKKSFFEFHFW